MPLVVSGSTPAVVSPLVPSAAQPVPDQAAALASHLVGASNVAAVSHRQDGMRSGSQESHGSGPTMTPFSDPVADVRAREHAALQFRTGRVLDSDLRSIALHLIPTLEGWPEGVSIHVHKHGRDGRDVYGGSAGSPSSGEIHIEETGDGRYVGTDGGKHIASGMHTGSLYQALLSSLKRVDRVAHDTFELYLQANSSREGDNHQLLGEAIADQLELGWGPDGQGSAVLKALCRRTAAHLPGTQSPGVAPVAEAHANPGKALCAVQVAHNELTPVAIALTGTAGLQVKAAPEAPLVLLKPENSSIDRRYAALELLHGVASQLRGVSNAQRRAEILAHLLDSRMVLRMIGVAQVRVDEGVGRMARGAITDYVALLAAAVKERILDPANVVAALLKPIQMEDWSITFMAEVAGYASCDRPLAHALCDLLINATSGGEGACDSAMLCEQLLDPRPHADRRWLNSYADFYGQLFYEGKLSKKFPSGDFVAAYRLERAALIPDRARIKAMYSPKRANKYRKAADTAKAIAPTTGGVRALEHQERSVVQVADNIIAQLQPNALASHRFLEVMGEQLKRDEDEERRFVWGLTYD